MFSPVFVSMSTPGKEDTPVLLMGGGSTLISCQDQAVSPSQVRTVGSTPIAGQDGGTPAQLRMEATPIPGQD